MRNSQKDDVEDYLKITKKKLKNFYKIQVQYSRIFYRFILFFINLY